MNKELYNCVKYYNFAHILKHKDKPTIKIGRTK